jgi:DOPA 4,5-dioxygenase
MGGEDMTDETVPGPGGKVADPARISEYHAHIYYDPAFSRDRASVVRDHIAAAFPEARLGHWHDQPVGPHTQAMYQIAFPPALLPRLLPWLMLNRLGLTVLLHPDTGNDLDDHTDHAAWLGAVLPLRLDVLKE